MLCMRQSFFILCWRVVVQRRLPALPGPVRCRSFFKRVCRAGAPGSGQVPPLVKAGAWRAPFFCWHLSPATPTAHRCLRIGRSRAPRPQWFSEPGRTSGGGWDTRGVALFDLDFCQRVGVVFLIAALAVVRHLKTQTDISLIWVAFFDHAFQHLADNQHALSI